MIVLDIETSGVDFSKCGVWQIGAIDLETGEEFLEEARIDKEDFILDDSASPKTVFEVTGKTEDQLRDNNKQSQRQLIENFFNWAKSKRIKTCLCQNPQFDLGFIFTKARKYGLYIEVHYRALDLHSIAQVKFFEKERKLNVNLEKHRLAFGLSEILEFCGLKDERKNHNALEDCKLTSECFFRLVYGKYLIKDYEEFKIPNYLRNALKGTSKEKNER